jgi:hypothetical protein
MTSMAIFEIAAGPHGPTEDPRHFPHIDGYWHDSAAVLIDRGEVVCAYEEERLTRVKHTTSFPTRAVGACLAERLETTGTGGRGSVFQRRLPGAVF